MSHFLNVFLFFRSALQYDGLYGANVPVNNFFGDILEVLGMNLNSKFCLPGREFSMSFDYTKKIGCFETSERFLFFSAYPTVTTVKYINHTIINLHNISHRPTNTYYAEYHHAVNEYGKDVIRFEIQISDL